MQSSAVKNTHTSYPFFLPFNYTLCIPIDDITNGPSATGHNNSQSASPNNSMLPIAVTSASSSSRVADPTKDVGVDISSAGENAVVRYTPRVSTLVPAPTFARPNTINADCTSHPLVEHNPTNKSSTRYTLSNSQLVHITSFPSCSNTENGYVLPFVLPICTTSCKSTSSSNVHLMQTRSKSHSSAMSCPDSV